MSNPKILAIIPARGGSKGIPRKNIKILAGKPLIVWTIEEAKKSKYISKLILSSDDDEIIEVAKEHGCEVPFKRPAEIAQDKTSGMEPVLHALSQCPNFDYVLMLQPTSPFRTVEDIDGMIEKFLQNQCTFSVSVTKTKESPYWMYHIENEKMEKLLPFNQLTTRQSLPQTYILNGALYMAKTKDFLEKKSFLNEETTPFIMSEAHSYDIDEPIDFEICDYIMKRHLNNNFKF